MSNENNNDVRDFSATLEPLDMIELESMIEAAQERLNELNAL